jgi:hypothetical protein
LAGLSTRAVFAVIAVRTAGAAFAGLPALLGEGAALGEGLGDALGFTAAEAFPLCDLPFVFATAGP